MKYDLSILKQIIISAARDELLPRFADVQRTTKIDGSFVRDITENRISESMVAAITQVAKVMELETVAEYVESIETKKLVAELGVDYAQGHAVGRPIPLDQVLGNLTGHSKSSTA